MLQRSPTLARARARRTLRGSRTTNAARRRATRFLPSRSLTERRDGAPRRVSAHAFSQGPSTTAPDPEARCRRPPAIACLGESHRTGPRRRDRCSRREREQWRLLAWEHQLERRQQSLLTRGDLGTVARRAAGFRLPRIARRPASAPSGATGHQSGSGGGRSLARPTTRQAPASPDASSVAEERSPDSGQRSDERHRSRPCVLAAIR